MWRSYRVSQGWPGTSAPGPKATRELAAPRPGSPFPPRGVLRRSHTWAQPRGHPLVLSYPRGTGLCITQGDSPSRNRPQAVLWCLRPALQPAASIHLRAQCWLPSPLGPPPIDRPWCVLIITVHFTVIHVQEVSYSSYLCDGSNLLRLISSQLDLRWWQVGCWRVFPTR